MSTLVGNDSTDSVTLTQALGRLNARINKNRADTRALEAALPRAVINSADAGAEERRMLADLQSEHSALIATADTIRREIAVKLQADAVTRRAELLAELRVQGDRFVASVREFQDMEDEGLKAARQVHDQAAALRVRLPGPPVDAFNFGRRLELRRRFKCSEVYGAHGTMLDTPELEAAIDLPAAAENYVAGILVQAEDAPVVPMPAPVETDAPTDESPTAESEEVAAHE